MRILGIDPGYGIVGYGVVDHERGKNRYISHGASTTPAGMPFHLRLMEIYDDMGILIDKYKPDAVAVEELFFNTNVKTAIQVGHARGVILLACGQKGIPIFEYTPLQVKQAVVGYGRAEKKQVMEMTRIILGLKAVPRPDDAADALAIAIFHGHTASSALSQ